MREHSANWSQGLLQVNRNMILNVHLSIQGNYLPSCVHPSMKLSLHPVCSSSVHLVREGERMFLSLKAGRSSEIRAGIHLKAHNTSVPTHRN